MIKVVSKIQMARSIIPRCLALVAGTAGISLCGARPVQADVNYLYNLGDFTDSKVINTSAESPTPKWGFSFTVPTGYEATFSKIGFWVKDVSFTNARAGVRLYSSADITNPIVSKNLSSASTASNSCTIADGAGRNDFCWNTLPSVQTLSSGTYYLISDISTALKNQNTFYASTLDASTEFVNAASNVNWGSPVKYNGTTYTAFEDSQYGFFGPNLGLFAVNALPGPGVAVPAPLPLFGGMAAVAWSRRIKKRITQA
jgi:hypothetical protein